MNDNRMEFSVEMTSNACANLVRKTLKQNDIELVSLDIERDQVVVKSSLNSFLIKEIIESKTGKRAALVGSGLLGAAVAELKGTVQGVVRLSQMKEDKCLVEGVIDGLTPGSVNSLKIHQYGDLTEGCESCGDVFQPFANQNRTYGSLGNIEADKSGRANFQFVDNIIHVWDVIGRSVVVHNENRLSCAIIARSSGLFENTKRLCTCDGISIWDERNVPAAGKERLKFAQQHEQKL